MFLEQVLMFYLQCMLHFFVTNVRIVNLFIFGKHWRRMWTIYCSWQAQSCCSCSKKHTSHKLLYLKVMFFFQIISKFQRIIILFAYFSCHPPNTSPLPARSTAPLFVSLSLHLFCWKKNPKTNKINSGCFFSHTSRRSRQGLCGGGLM